MNECNKTFSDVFEQNEEISQKLTGTKFRRVNSLAQAKMQDVLKKNPSFVSLLQLSLEVGTTGGSNGLRSN